MIVNFRTREISRGKRKLGRIPTLIIIKKKDQNSNINNTGKKKKEKRNGKKDNKWTMSNLSQILLTYSVMS
jgi:hypothetical protein